MLSDVRFIPKAAHNLAKICSMTSHCLKGHSLTNMWNKFYLISRFDRLSNPIFPEIFVVVFVMANKNEGSYLCNERWKNFSKQEIVSSILVAASIFAYLASSTGAHRDIVLCSLCNHI